MILDYNNSMGFPVLAREYNNKFYGGLIGAVGLRIIGFTFIVVSQLIMARLMLNAIDLIDLGDIDPLLNLDFDVIHFLLRLSNVGKPLIIISLFMKVFTKQEKLTKALIMSSILAVVFYIFEVLIYFILYPFIYELFGEYQVDPTTIELVIPYIDAYVIGFTDLNIFLDTTLCILIYLFLVYEPAKIKGKKLTAYRCLTILPVLWILVTYILNVLINTGVIITNNVYTNALFTKTSLPTFSIFFIIIGFVKLFKHWYLKKNFITPYETFVKSNKYGFYFSLVIAGSLAIISLLAFAFSFIPNNKDFLLGSNYWFFLGIPFVLIFNINLKNSSKIPAILHPIWMVVHYIGFALIAVAALDSILMFLSTFM